MAAKSIIAIDVDDSKFKEFMSLFESYKATLAELPGDWAKTNEATASVADGFVDMTAALMAQVEQHRKIDAAEQASAKAAREAADAKKDEDKRAAGVQAKYQANIDRVSRTTKDIRTNTAGVVKDLASGAVSLLKWIGITGAFSGLLGAGGLFGLDRLGEGAASSRRLSQGLGTSSGNERAFSTNYGRYVDADPFLANVNEASHDLTQQWKITAASGLSSAQIKGKDTADIAAMMLPLMAQRFKAAGSTTQAMHAYGMDQFVTLQDLIRYNAGSDEEHRKSSDAYNRDKGTFAESDKTQEAWQDFVTQLERAGKEIAVVFEQGLEPLAPQISQLSGAVADTIKSLMSAPKFKEWIVDAAEGVHQFGDYIKSEKFQQDVQKFVEGVGKLADGVVEAFRVLGIIDRPPPDPATASNRDILQWNLRHPDQQLPYHPGMSADDPTTPDEKKNGGVNSDKDFRWWLPDSYFHHKAGSAPWENTAPATSTILDGIKVGENSGRNAVSPKGAKGVYQFMPDTAKQYGLDDPTNEFASRIAAGHYVEHLMGVFDNNVEKAIASYNWGEGNVQNDVAANGDKWRDHLPSETRSYLEKVTKSINATNATMSVKVENQTGGSAVITSSQLAPQ